MEDSDAHARRNVVFLSASILAAWWLHLDLPGLLALLHVAALAEVATARRLWLGLAALLAYLLLRYHFSPQRVRHWRNGEKRVNIVRRAAFWLYVRHDLARDRTSRTLAAWERRNREATTVDEKAPARFTGADVEQLTVIPTGYNSASIEYQWFDDAPGEAEERSNMRAFEGMDTIRIPSVIALPLFLGTWLSRLFISRAGLEVSFPYYLGIAAVAVCLSKSGIQMHA